MDNLSRKQILDIAYARQKDAIEMAELKSQARNGGGSGGMARATDYNSSGNTGSSRSRTDDFVEDSAPAPLAMGDGSPPLAAITLSPLPVPFGSPVESGPVVFTPPLARDMAAAQPSRPKIRRPLVIAACAVLLVMAALVVVVPVVVLAGGDVDSSQDSILAEALTTAAPTPERVLVPGLSNETLEAIKLNPHTPQAMAYEWVEKDPFLGDYPDWRRQQRFALVVVYYSTGMRNAMLLSNFWLSYYTHECEWPRLEYPCTSDGHYRRLLNELEQSIKGGLPQELALLSHLETIDYSGSFQNMPLADFVPHPLPPSIQDFRCNKCHLEGQIPPNFFAERRMTNLTRVDLGQNALTGSLPGELGSQLQTSLDSLVLNGNDFDATIPSELGLLSKLEALDLGNNILSGTIPVELAELSALAAVDFGENPDLAEYIPEEFCSDDRVVQMSFLRTDWCQDLPTDCSSDVDLRPSCCEQQRSRRLCDPGVAVNPEDVMPLH